MQIEGLCIDEGVSFVDLKATLSEFARRFYAGSSRVRLAPELLPVRRTGRGDGRGRRSRRRQRRAVGRDPGLRHGAPERAGGRRHRQREVLRLGLRDGARADRDVAPQAAGHPACSTTPTCASWSSSPDDHVARAGCAPSCRTTRRRAQIGALLNDHAVTLDGHGVACGSDLAPIVVGLRRRTRRSIPDSDHLSITKVDDGSGTLLGRGVRRAERHGWREVSVRTQRDGRCRTG
jgi:hypothetical protein